MEQDSVSAKVALAQLKSILLGVLEAACQLATE